MPTFYNLAPTEFSAAVITLNLVLTLVLELVVVYMYKKTHQGLSYSSSFVFTFLLVGLIGAVVMMVVQHNLARAFGLLGAFSLIRFRTILKETRDIAFLFFALGVGIAVGTNNYAIAFISTIFISAAIWFFYRYHIGQVRNRLGHVLTFSAQTPADADRVKDSLREHADCFELLQARVHGATTRYVYTVRFKDGVDPAGVVAALGTSSAITGLELLSEQGGVEY
ncbi:MAG: DUF4956 domain-containing protein [Patescibacteria group bacterium]